MTNSRVYFVKTIRNRLKYDIAHFDNPRTNPYSERLNLFRFTDLRMIDLPILLRIYKNWKVITEEQRVSLMSQINSPDREAWYLAFCLIYQIKPFKIISKK